MKRFYIFTVLLLVSSYIYSLEIGLESGASFFSYAEVSENNKDDLYQINSGLIGVVASQDISFVDVLLSVKAQLPYELTFTDAFGTDDFNYLEGLYYYGLNSQLGVSYPIINNKMNLSVGLLFNHDYFYFEDQSKTSDNVYVFSVIGNAIRLNFAAPITSKLEVGINGAGAVNYLPVGDRAGQLKWSYNILVNAFLMYKI